MINDHEIDLTEEHKFSNHNGIRKVTYFGKLKHIPWDEILSLDKSHPKRSYGDSLSDTFGNTVRRTSDNTFMVMGDRYLYTKEVLEEFFLEEFGYIPNSALQYCYRCGHGQIARNMVIYCDHCETNIRAAACEDRLFGIEVNTFRGKYVPWMDYHVMRQLDNSVKIEKPSGILQSLIKKY